MTDRDEKTPWWLTIPRGCPRVDCDGFVPVAADAQVRQCEVCDTAYALDRLRPDYRTICSRLVDTLRRWVTNSGISLDRIILHGSFSPQTQRLPGSQSDLDILLVSPDWEGVESTKRATGLRDTWIYSALPIPDIMALTPDEFHEYAEEEQSAVSRAFREGVDLSVDEEGEE